MIRKKKSKMVRKKQKETQTFLPILQNWGGHIPHVGDYCLKEHLRFMNKGTVWLDSSICHNCSNKPCKYYKEWKKMVKI